VRDLVEGGGVVGVGVGERLLGREADHVAALDVAGAVAAVHDARAGGVDQGVGGVVPLEHRGLGQGVSLGDLDALALVEVEHRVRLGEHQLLDLAGGGVRLLAEVPEEDAGALLAFIISLDDFIVSYFLAGPGGTTLPVYIFGMIRNAITPGVNALSSMLLAVSILVVMISYLLTRKKR
jgi:hypothetical protein